MRFLEQSAPPFPLVCRTVFCLLLTLWLGLSLAESAVAQVPKPGVPPARTAAAAPETPPAAAAPAAAAPVAPAVAQPAVPAPAPGPAAQPAAEPEAPAGPTQVKVGMFLTQLYDLDVPRKSFNVSFWAWFIHNSDKFKPLETVEIVNAKNSSIKYPSTTETNGLQWVQGKYSATVSEDWEVEKFPFDRQTLNILIEDGQNDANAIEFIADSENSKIDKSVSVPGWSFEKFEIKSGTTLYDTTYGDPNLQGQSTYSRVVASITMKRNGVRLLSSIFLGFFVAFLLATLTYFLDTDMMAGARISLCAGAIFASVGNKIAVDNILTPSSKFTLADGIEGSSFMVILCAIAVVVMVREVKDSYPVAAKWLNRGAGTLITGSYLVFNGWLIAWATS
jgi:hypothetical protein